MSTLLFIKFYYFFIGLKHLLPDLQLFLNNHQFLTDCLKIIVVINLAYFFAMSHSVYLHPANLTQISALLQKFAADYLPFSFILKCSKSTRFIQLVLYLGVFTYFILLVSLTSFFVLNVLVGLWFLYCLYLTGYIEGFKNKNSNFSLIVLFIVFIIITNAILLIYYPVFYNSILTTLTIYSNNPHIVIITDSIRLACPNFVKRIELLLLPTFTYVTFTKTHYDVQMILNYSYLNLIDTSLFSNTLHTIAILNGYTPPLLYQFEVFGLVLINCLLFCITLFCV